MNKRYNGMGQNSVKFIIVLGVVMLVFAFLSGIAKPKEEEATEPETTTSETETLPEIETVADDGWTHVTATDMIKLYCENQVKYGKEYNEKYIRLTGVVEEINAGANGDAYFELESNDDSAEYIYTYVTCKTNKTKMIDQIAELKPGNEVTLIGQCSSDSSLTVRIIDIESVE